MKYDFSDFDKQYDFSDFAPDNDISEMESGLRGVTQGVSMGFADEITGGAEALWKAAKGDPRTFEELYKASRDESRQNYSAAQEANPVSYGAGEIGGAIGSAFIPGLGVLNATKGASLAARAGLGAVQGGLTGLGNSKAEDAAGIAKDTATGAAIGGAFPIVLHGAGKALNATSEKVIKPFLQKVSKVDSNEYKQLVPAAIGRGIGLSDTKSIAKYAANPSAFENPMTKEAIKNELDDVMFNNKNMVDGLKNELGLHEEAFNKELQNQIEGLKENRQYFNESIKHLESSLKNKTPNENVYEDIASAVQSLKDDVSQSSGAAFNILENEGISLDKKKLKDAYLAGVKALKIESQAPVGSSVYKDFSSLKSQIDRIDDLPESVSLPNVKRIIQDLDAEIEYSASMGDFSSRGNQARQQIRGEIDSILKQTSPNYAQMMGVVDEKARLLQEVNKKFGTEEKILQKVNGLSFDANNTNLDLLTKIEAQPGSITEQVNDYLTAKYNLKRPARMRELHTELPGFKQLGDVDRDAYKRFGNFASPTDLKNEVAENNLSAAMDIEDMGTKLAHAEKQTKHNYIAPNSTESYINGFLTPSGASIEKDRILNRLQQYKPMEEIDLEQIPLSHKISNLDRQLQEPSSVGNNIRSNIENLKVNRAFEKDTTNGSRNTLFGGVIGGGVGGVIGAVGGNGFGIPTAIGATLGYATDKFGGAGLKLGIKGVDIVSKIMSKVQGSKYSQVFEKAAQRGPQAVAATHFIMEQNDPDYRQLHKED